MRWCSKLRSIATLHSSTTTTTTTTKPLRHSHLLLHSSSNLLHKTFTVPVLSSNFKPLFIAPSASKLSLFKDASPLPHSLIQVRNLTLKQRKRKLKSRKPATPVVSKVKKIKMKYYSSYKGRFRTMKEAD